MGQDNEIDSIPILIENHENGITVNINYGLCFSFGEKDDKGEKLLSGFEIMDKFIPINETRRELKSIFPNTYEEVYAILIEQSQNLRLY